MKQLLYTLEFIIICLLIGCSENDVEREINAQKSEGTTRATTVELYPSQYTIYYNFQGIMNMIWNWTKQSANMGETREMGVVFYIGRHLIDGSWYDLKAGELQRGPIKKSAKEQGSITLTIKNDNYCGFFHTHTPMCTLPDENVERDFGPSSADRWVGEKFGVPQFLYDYIQVVDHDLPLNSPSQIFSYGPETRIK